MNSHQIIQNVFQQKQCPICHGNWKLHYDFINTFSCQNANNCNLLFRETGAGKIIKRFNLPQDAFVNRNDIVWFENTVIVYKNWKAIMKLSCLDFSTTQLQIETLLNFL